MNPPVLSYLEKHFFRDDEFEKCDVLPGDLFSRFGYTADFAIKPQTLQNPRAGFLLTGDSPDWGSPPRSAGWVTADGLSYEETAHDGSKCVYEMGTHIRITHVVNGAVSLKKDTWGIRIFGVISDAKYGERR